VLAAAMKISPTFGFFKIITIAFMSFALGLWYWLLMRFVPMKRAAQYTLLTAIVSHVYTLSFWMHSDALFCLLATAAMVVACQINERRSHVSWRIAALALLCIAGIFVRWAGMLQWLVIAGLLVRGRSLDIRKWLQPGREAPVLIALGLSCVVTFGTFAIIRHALKLTPEQERAAKEAGVTLDERQQLEAPIESRTLDIYNKPSIKTTFAQEMIKRVRESGKWFAWLLWPELRFIGGIKSLSSVDTILGWLLIVPLAVAAWLGLKKREWMWLGIAIYCACLCLNWPNPNARYMVPILPLILLGIVEGIRTIFIASVAVASALLLAVDIKVARASDFYHSYEGGLNQSLISCVKTLEDRDVKGGELAVSEVYSNLGKRKPSKFGLRATVMLSNLVVRNMPPKIADNVDTSGFVRYARSRHVRYYLYQQPISPWRVWHFRLHPWVQKMLTGQPVPPSSAGWVLYRYVSPTSVIVPFPMPHLVVLQPAHYTRMEVQSIRDWPTRVPGM
jgi:hypothetical protein